MEPDKPMGIDARKVAFILASLNGVMALLALISWLTGRWEWLSLGTDRVPIAPATALLLVLLNAVLLTELLGPENRVLRRFGQAVAIIIAVSGLLALLRPFFGWSSPLEQWLAGTTRTLGGLAVGQMSPLTGLAFLILSFIFPAGTLPFLSKRLLRLIEFGSSMLVFLISAVVILGYVAGTPVFSDRPIIPMALWTAVSFILMSVAMALKYNVRERAVPFAATTGKELSAQRWLWVLLFSLVVLVIVAAGFVYYRSEAIRIQENKSDELAVIGKMKVEQILRWRKERIGDVTRLANALPLRMEAWLRDRNDPMLTENIVQRLQLESKIDIYFQALLGDGEKHILLSFPETPEMETESWDAVKKAWHGSEPVLSDLHYTTFGRIHEDVAMALRDESGQPLAVIILTTDAQEFLFPMIQAWPTPSPSAESLLVRRDGDEVLFLNDLRHRKDTALFLRFPLTKTTLPAVQAVLGRTGAFFGKDYRGVEVLSDLRPVPGTSWCLVSKVDTAEILKEVRYRAVMIFTIVTVLILGVSGLTAYLYQTQKIEERRRAEGLLRDSEVRYRRLFEAAKDGILILDAETGMIVDVNPYLIEILGYSLDQFLGKRVWEVGFLKDVIANKDNFLKLQREKYVRYEDLPLEAADGRKIDVEFVSNVYRIDHHEVIQCNIRDITERKRVEKANILNNHRTQALLKLNQMTESTLKEITDYALEEAVRLTQSKIGYLAFLNEDESVLTMHSWSKTAMAECAISQKPILYPVETTGLWGEAVRQRRAVITNDYAAPSSLKKGCPQGHVVVKRHMNTPVFEGSRIVIIAGVGNKDEEYNQGDVVQLTLLMEGMWRLLERKRMERELIQVKDTQFRTLMENLPSKVFLKDLNSVYVSCNSNYARDLKIKPEEIVGKTDYDFFPTPLAEKYRRDDKRIMESGKTESSEEEYQVIGDYLEGSQKAYISIVKTPVRDKAGNVTGLFSFFWDITERKVLEAEKKRVEVLASVSETKTRFASMVSHELRSPLAVIKEALDIVLEGMVGSVNDEQKDILGMAKTNIDRLGRLINNVLDFQKIALGKMAFDIRENDLNEVVAEVHKSMSILSKRKGLDLRMDLEEGLPKMKFDRDRLIQVLTNLMSNAINNTERGSVILDAKREDDMVHISVQDAGIGISAEEIPKLFQPFEQVAGLRSKQKGGTGLGLAISKEIVLAHHGKIWVESHVGKGSTFHFTLPLWK